jgi:hypothetical protein
LAILLAPLGARASIPGGETVSIDLASSWVANNFVLFTVPGGNAASVDAGQTSSTKIQITVAGLPAGTPVTLNLTATAGDTSTGAPVIGYPFQIQVYSGQGIIIPLPVDASAAQPGNYQLQLTATDASSQVMGSSPPRVLLVTTPAADFQSLTASTRMTVIVTGTQTLLKAMAPALPGADLGGPPPVSTGAPAHFRMIFYNKSPQATLQITSGGSTFLLAPGDVIAADLSTQFDVVATIYDGANGTMEIALL